MVESCMAVDYKIKPVDEFVSGWSSGSLGDDEYMQMNNLLPCFFVVVMHFFRVRFFLLDKYKFQKKREGRKLQFFFVITNVFFPLSSRIV